MKEQIIGILKRLETFRLDPKTDRLRPDHVIRCCQAIVASVAGYQDRAEWVAEVADELVRTSL